MKLAAIISTKVTFLVELVDLIPQGKVFAPDLISAVTAVCGFIKAPQNLTGNDPQQAMSFEFGKWKDQPVNKLSLFRDGISIETASNSEDTEKALLELLLWSKDSLGVQFDPKMVKRTIYYSQLTVYLDARLDSINPILVTLAQELTTKTSEQFLQPIPFRTSGITLAVNPLNVKFSAGTFSIERRIDWPDSENKYYSQAPLRTNDHLELLEKLERSLQS